MGSATHASGPASHSGSVACGASVQSCASSSASKTNDGPGTDTRPRKMSRVRPSGAQGLGLQWIGHDTHPFLPCWAPGNPGGAPMTLPSWRKRLDRDSGGRSCQDARGGRAIAVSRAAAFGRARTAMRLGRTCILSARALSQIWQRRRGRCHGIDKGSLCLVTLYVKPNLHVSPSTVAACTGPLTVRVRQAAL